MRYIVSRVQHTFGYNTKDETYLNINVVAPSSENRTAGGEYRSFVPHNSALSELSESTSTDRTNKLFDGGPNRREPPTHCLPSNRPVHQISSITY